jgi:hypothetical protein
MKTETTALQYSNYPLKITEHRKDKTYLNVVRKEAFSNTYHFYANSMVNDPENWDVSWFGNYE